MENKKTTAGYLIIYKDEVAPSAWECYATMAGVSLTAEAIKFDWVTADEWGPEEHEIINMEWRQ